MDIVTKIIFAIVSLTLSISGVLSVEVEYRKEEFLTITNYLRSSVVPVASNMHKLKWDDHLAKKAGVAAAKCTARHTKNIDYYQNLVASGTKNVTINLMYFFMERDYYNYNAPDKNDFYVTGHYQVMTKASMTKIGCAVTAERCGKPKSYFTFCNYLHERLGWGKYNYLSEKPCSQCSARYSYCDNGLCVAKSNSCKKICRNCGYFYDGDCRCYCNPGFLAAPDCSIRDPGVTMGTCKNCVSHTPVYRALCDNGGNITGAECGGSCKCPSGFSGRWCQYNADEHRNGVLLTFHWSKIYKGSQLAYYPMNVGQGKTILEIIAPIIARKVGRFKAGDVKVGSGYPELDKTGKLHILVVIKNGGASQDVLLSGLKSVKAEMNKAINAATGTTLESIATKSI